MNLAIGLIVSHGFPIPEAFQASYHKLWSHVLTGACNATLPPEVQVGSVHELRTTAFPIDYARNDVVRKFLAEPSYDALLFVDADQTYPENLVEQLVRHQVPVVCCRYHMRKPPFHAVAYVKHRVVNQHHAYAPIHFGRGLIEIERGGGGGVLIQRAVLEAIRDRQQAQWTAFFASPGYAALPDWFRAQLPPAPLIQWFKYQCGPEPPYDLTVSEDFWFYRQAREAGFACYVDWECESQHLQTFGIDRDWNLQYLDKQLAELSTMAPAERQKILDHLVVCGYPEGLPLPTGDRVPAYAVTPGER